MRALEDKKPKIKYRKGTSPLMYALSALPGRVVDWGYRTVLKLPLGGKKHA